MSARERSNAAHDQHRGNSRDRGYDAQWDRASLLFKRSHPLCLGCEALGRVTATAVTDHVVPHKGDAARFWDQSLWQPACRWHHDVVKQRLELMFERGALLLADLWLDSAVAVALSKRLGSSVGADGWSV
jgi:5-methylcytosine-specific restriction protein A